MKKTICFALGIVMFLAVFAGCKPHVVDHKPSIAVAERYYAALGLKSQEKVHTFFNPEFLAQYGNAWRNLLTGLAQKFGPVTEAKLVETKSVPIDQVGCSLLRYQVRRGTFVTQENIILKPSTGTSPAIIGYEMIRLDTGQKIEAGVTVHE